MPVTRDTLRLLDGMRRQLDNVIDDQVRDLVAAWATAWDEVAPDLVTALLELTLAADKGKVTRAMMIRSSRLQQALAVIADQLHDLAEQAGIRITADLDDVVRRAGEAQTRVLASQLPFSITDLNGWDRVDADQIAAIVERSTEQITSLAKPLSVDAYDAVRRELIRGVAAGSNPRATAQRMVSRVEQRFNGGLTRALVIARTETLDAHREAARTAEEANADVLEGWEWSAQLDARTCRACWAKDGTVYELGEPGPLGHQQCRCARLPKVKSWSELGFDDIDEPEDLRISAEDRFDQLPIESQRQILGPRGFEAWQQGLFPMSQWAVRHKTPGWRDSYRVATPPRVGVPASSPKKRATAKKATPKPKAARKTKGFTPPKTPQLDALAKKTDVWDLDDDIAALNPNYGDPGFDINCVHVVNAFELRMRGHDVEATVLPKSLWPLSGRNATEALHRWVDPQGNTRDFVNVKNKAGLEAAVKQWPDGARGWVILTWPGGGGHIFSVMNEGGKVRYIEGQVPGVDAATYFSRAKRGFTLVVRTDDLIATDSLIEFVEDHQPGGGTP